MRIRTVMKMMRTRKRKRNALTRRKTVMKMVKITLAIRLSRLGF
jgi:hypothetical protein